MSLQKITITKSSLYFRECKACGCVTLHVGKAEDAHGRLDVAK